MNREKFLKSIFFRGARKILWDNGFLRILTRNMSDHAFLPINYWWQRLEKLDLENPRTYTDKLQWMKANYRNDVTTQCTDKYLVREHITSVMGPSGERILNELYGVYANPDDINLDLLPKSFILKANHGSGWNIIVNDKDAINWGKCKYKMRKWLKSNYYYAGHEYQYKNISPRIICEKYLRNKDGSEILDYKFMCFNGKPETVWIDYDRHTNHKRNFYTIEGRPLYYVSDEPADYSITFSKPDNYEEMIKIAEKLSKGFPHVRIDLYNVDGQILFGEMTFTSWGGCSYFGTSRLNKMWGDLFPFDFVTNQKDQG